MKCERISANLKICCELELRLLRRQDDETFSKISFHLNNEKSCCCCGRKKKINEIFTWKKDSSEEMENNESRKEGPITVTIHYASQTGQAEAIAKEIHAACPDQGVLADIFCLSLTEKKFCINKEKLAIFVASTTGDGEPPDTARKFLRRLNKKTLPKDYLKDLWFGFLALGDSNYTNFCNFGKTLEKRLLELGARPFYPTGYADDAVGLEIVVEPWIEGLWSALRNHHNNIVRDQDTKMALSECYSAQKELQNTLSTLKIDVEVEGTVKNGKSVESSSNKEATLSSNGITGKIQAENASNDNSDKKVANNWTTPFQSVVDKTLKLPKCSPTCNFAIEYHPEWQPDNTSNNLTQSFTNAISEVKMAKIIAARRLTREDAVKTTLELQLDISELELEYQPGDTFGIVCPNDDETVDYLLERIGLKDSADQVFTVKSTDNTETSSFPAHIPQKSTLKHIFKILIDIRAVPKKALLRMLADYTEDFDQKRRLQELSSIQGAKEYTKWIREPNTSIIDILRGFPSCCPPVERLLESLPRLQPRSYSVASSPLHGKNYVKFVFNITVIQGFDGVTLTRTGLCTGWLDRLTSWKNDEIIEKEKTKSPPEIPIFWRRRTSFHLPADSSLPVIMIGPGTGIAPFIGFLQHRELQKMSNPDGNWGQMLLFFGCRHKQRDFLYKNDLEDFVSKTILTKLFVSFSREEDQKENAPRYVQDNMLLNQDLIMSLILEKNAVIYICGDAANMARNVRQTMIRMFQNTLNISEESAIIQLKKLVEEKRFLEDIWT